MSVAVTLKATPRTNSGSRAAIKLRKQGLVPAVVYGHKLDNAQVAVNAEELDRAIRVQHARVLELEIDGKAETVLIRELQWDYLGKQMIHVDFERKDRAELVRVTVPVELRNAPKATGGGVLDQPLHTLHVECPLGSIPEAIRIDLTNLTLGSPIHVKELKLPEGVKVLRIAGSRRRATEAAGHRTGRRTDRTGHRPRGDQGEEEGDEEEEEKK